MFEIERRNREIIGVPMVRSGFIQYQLRQIVWEAMREGNERREYSKKEVRVEICLIRVWCFRSSPDDNGTPVIERCSDFG